MTAARATVRSPSPITPSQGNSRRSSVSTAKDKKAVKTKKTRKTPPRRPPAAAQKKDSKLRELLVNALAQFPYRISPSVKRRLLTAVDLLEDRPADVARFLDSSDALDTQLIQDQPLLREGTVELLFQLLTVLAICGLAFAVGITIGSIVCRTTLISGSAIVSLDVEPPAVVYTDEFPAERAQVTLLLPDSHTWEKKPNITAILRGRFNLSLPEYSLGSYVEALSAVLTLTYLPATHIGKDPAVCFPNLQPPNLVNAQSSAGDNNQSGARAYAAAADRESATGNSGGGVTLKTAAANAAQMVNTTASGGAAAAGGAGGGGGGGTAAGGAGGGGGGGTAAGGSPGRGLSEETGRTPQDESRRMIDKEREKNTNASMNGSRFSQKQEDNNTYIKDETLGQREGAIDRRLAVPPDDRDPSVRRSLNSSHGGGGREGGPGVPSSLSNASSSVRPQQSPSSSSTSLAPFSSLPLLRLWRLHNSEFMHRFAASTAERLRRSRVARISSSTRGGGGRGGRGGRWRQGAQLDGDLDEAMIMTAAAVAARGRTHDMFNVTNYALVHRAIHGLSLMTRAGVTTRVPLEGMVYNPISGAFEENSLMLVRHSAAAGFPIELLEQAATQSGELQPTLLFRSILPFVVGLSHGFNEVHVTAGINVSLTAENEQLLKALREDCALKRVFLSLEITVQAVRTMFFKQTHGKRLMETFHVLCSISTVTEEAKWPPPPPGSFVRDVAELASEYTSISLGFSNAV